jgi:hypothetical protein
MMMSHIHNSISHNFLLYLRTKRGSTRQSLLEINSSNWSQLAVEKNLSDLNASAASNYNAKSTSSHQYHDDFLSQFSIIEVRSTEAYDTIASGFERSGN